MMGGGGWRGEGSGGVRGGGGVRVVGRWSETVVCAGVSLKRGTTPRYSSR